MFDLKIRTRKMEVCHPQRGQLCSKCLHIYIYICRMILVKTYIYIYTSFYFMLLVCIVLHHIAFLVALHKNHKTYDVLMYFE